MRKPLRGRLSVRDRIESNNRAFRAWGAAFNKPDVAERLVTPLPPKRDRIKRPVDGRPVGPTEHQEQSAVVSWWWRAHAGYQIPPFALFAIPNGGARDVITGSRLKAEGVRRGTPDLMLAAARGPHHGLFIEMKVGDNKPSSEQSAFLEYLIASGYKAVVHYSAEAAIHELKEYLA